MDLEKLKKDDIRMLTSGRLGELERDLRQSLAMLKMKPHEEAKLMKQRPALRKNLARVLTFKKQYQKNETKK